MKSHIDQETGTVKRINLGDLLVGAAALGIVVVVLYHTLKK